MRLSLFISSLYGGGAERVTCNLANYLARHGHEVEILTMSETEQSYELDNHVKTSTLLPLNDRKGTIWNTLIRFPRLWKYMLQTKQDAYVVMLPSTTILLLMFRWMTKAKIIASERVDPAVYPDKLAKRLKLYAKKADGFVFQTEDAKAWYGDSLKEVKTTVIPNAINPAFIRPQYQGKKRKLIAGAGRLNSQKKFSLLIKAFAIVSKEFHDYNLAIYGEGEERQELERMIQELGLTDRVSLPGNIQNIAETMEKNSLFVLSSDFEGMPNALMEAMALGLPCISTDCPCGGPRFLIKNGENGLLVPVGDVDAMAQAMRWVLKHRQSASEMGEKAREISNRLDPETIYGKWEEFIICVLA